MDIFNQMFQYVLWMSAKHHIDESHSVGHSLNVLYYADQIYNSEKKAHPILKKQKNIIYASAVLHDMCDKKYVDEKDSLQQLDVFLNIHTPVKNYDYSTEIFGQSILPKSTVVNKSGYFTELELNAIKQIISTMSYSKVKKTGFPELGPYKYAYHIVRESDLLTSYDFDRCILYDLHKNKQTLEQSFQNACDIFEKRMMKYNEDQLFLTDYSKKKSVELEQYCLLRIQHWKALLKPSTKLLK